jgi:hypothetical protein
MNTSEEIVYLENEDIKVTNKIVHYWTKAIVSSNICMVEVGKRKVKPPILVFGLAVLLFLVGLINGEAGEFVFPIGIILSLYGLALWYQKIESNETAIIVTLLTGKEIFIYEKQVDDFEKVYKALIDMLRKKSYEK